MKWGYSDLFRPGKGLLWLWYGLGRFGLRCSKPELVFPCHDRSSPRWTRLLPEEFCQVRRPVGHGGRVGSLQHFGGSFARFPRSQLRSPLPGGSALVLMPMGS